MIFGALIGKGASRLVFVYVQNPDLVIKVEHLEIGNNAREAQNFETLQRIGLASWAAPCWLIGPNLLMRRTAPADPSIDYPAAVPSMFKDLKFNNWGLLDGRLVCHDYAHIGLTPTLEMKKAKWKQNHE